MSEKPLSLVIVTGTSGSGKSTAMRALEDLGYFCIDNLPAPFLARLLELLPGSAADVELVAVGMDVREGPFLESAPGALDEVRRAGHSIQVLFLDCRDETLIRRFSETRRRHPLAAQGTVVEGIAREREQLAELGRLADQVLDTSQLTVHELRELVRERFAPASGASGPAVTLMSFGFRHGIPTQADLVLDLRFLPNPYFVDELRPLKGTDPRVAAYVLGRAETREFLQRVESLLAYLLPHYRREGKSYLTVALGCTGGRHRSVVLTQALAERLAFDHPRVAVRHRDIEKE